MSGKLQIISSGIVILALCAAAPGFSQTASTGALTGTTMDATRAVIPGVEITLANEATSESRSAVSNENGSYSFQLLAPGAYRLEAALSGFKTAVVSVIRISVTETTRVDVQLEVGGLSEKVTVETAPVMVQQESSALGRVVTENVVASLPLVNRNFTQIIGLSPGITIDVTHAGELGRGSGGMTTARTSVNGGRAYDNNFMIDGIDANDFQQSDAGNTGGTAVPNPDAIQEFKVQTGQVDASFGRNAGAQVNIITKSGTNDLHGSLFEFFRNEALNANDFFFNRNGLKKPVVRQNQYGGTIGGPIKRDKLFFFGSYQGTQQAIGIAAGKARGICNSTISSPPLTDDRSAAALGRLFAGQRGQNGGTAILDDGSNINPVALRFLNLRLPNGNYLFPTPQTINQSLPFARQGFSAFSDPCTFDENQLMANADYLQTEKSKFAFRYFFSNSLSKVSFTNNSAAPGTPYDLHLNARVASVSHSYVFSPRMFNEFRAGFFVVPWKQDFIKPPFTWTSVGVHSPYQMIDVRPGITITGSYQASYGSDKEQPQRTFSGSDHLSYIYGKHNIRFGGGVTRYHDEVLDAWSSGVLTFQSFPDFLLGQSAGQNGSTFSNIFSSSYSVMPPDTMLRAWDFSSYIQDDMKLTSRFTFNAGLRFERFSHPWDRLGDDTNFELRRANPNPPPEGTYQGYVASSKYNYLSPNKPPLPPGVVQLDRVSVLDGNGQNTFAPRIGLAWQVLPNSSRLLLRAGYGWYYTRSVGLIYNYMGATARTNQNRSGQFNAAATFENPFQPLPPAYTTDRHTWIWTEPPYSPTTAYNVTMLAPDYRHALTQQFSLNIQSEFARNFLLEVGYVGSRATHLDHGVSPNQAALASPTNPIRGVTTNTVANISQRVVIQGFQPTGMSYVDSNGSSWYSSLQASITRRMSHGIQFLGSYTWSKTLSTDAAKDFRSGRGGTTPGDQLDMRQRYGRSELSRPHRFVFSYVYEVPNIAGQNRFVGKVVGGWSVSGVATFQTGSPASLLYTNATNVTGITSDRAQMAPGCTHADLVTPGRMQDKLNNYFNRQCLTTPPVVGADGRATAFGNTGVGIVLGPAQQNIDMSIARKLALFSESKILEFRAEFFNLFNTPQFSGPDTTLNSSTFGVISTTSVNPRFMQLAMKLSF